MKKVFKQHMILGKTFSSDQWLETMAQVVVLGVLLSFAGPTFAKTISKLECPSGEIAKSDGSGWVCADDNDTADSNAATICGTGQLLDGDGNCIAIPVDTDTNTNAATICSDDKVLMGDGSCKALPEDLPVLPTASSGGYSLVYCADTDRVEWKSGGPRYAIGDTGPAGGIVFHIEDGSCGSHGLEAAPVDQSSGVEWGCFGTDISGANGTTVGAGAQNTVDILAGCWESPIAAEVAANYSLNGFNDWFLPSIGELNLMYTNLHQAGLGGFASGGYWSSSEDFNNLAWVALGSNNWVVRDKNTTHRVRAARAF